MIHRFNAHFSFQLFKHYLSATRIDVLHSPFVYQLYTGCVQQKKLSDTSLLKAIREHRTDLSNDNRVLTHIDMGAGNSANKLQRVSSLLSKHAKSKRIAEILYRLAQKTQPNYAIELGTSLGMSTCYITAGALAEKNTAFKMHTIEGAPDIADIAKEGFHKIGLNQNIQSHVGHFDEVLPEILQTIPSIDLAYIDGNHQEEPTIRYFEMLLSKSHHHTILIFDDIHWSSGMTKAWNYIQNHPQVSVTVDLFFIGLVFLHSGQAKEHFKLRIW